jgi:hypothetical protein
MGAKPRDCVIQYLYVHARGDSLQYPSSRTSAGAEQLATRYLECALVQAASLRFNDADCDLMFVTNLRERNPLGRRGARLFERLQSFGVELRHADYAHRPPGPVGYFHASRYVLDAIEAVVADSAPDRRLLLTDVDCVWIRPQLVLAASWSDDAIGCIHMGYGLDWDSSGMTRSGYETLRTSAGERDVTHRWVGGELLTGEANSLLALVRACEELDGELRELDCVLGTEEQLLTLADALGRVRFHDLGDVAARIWTGPRHSGWNPPDPGALGFWHLPSEKGLSFRRAASALARGRSRALRRDLRTPARALRRFNVLGGSWTPRRVRDDSWLLVNRLRERVLARAR